MCPWLHHSCERKSTKAKELFSIYHESELSDLAIVSIQLEE